MRYQVECNICHGVFDSQVWEHEHVTECVKTHCVEQLPGESFDSWVTRCKEAKKK